MFRHRFDPSSLVAGVLYLGLAGLFLAAGFGGMRVSFAWVIPVVLIGLGAIGVLRIVFRSRRRPERR